MQTITFNSAEWFEKGPSNIPLATQIPCKGFSTADVYKICPLKSHIKRGIMTGAEARNPDKVNLEEPTRVGYSLFTGTEEDSFVMVVTRGISQQGGEIKSQR